MGQWGLAGMELGVDVRFTPRLRRALGRCEPHTGRISLHAGLQSPQHWKLLDQVLCHEAAHIAAYHLYGGMADPHGPEWADLVRAAGYTPEIRMRATALSTGTAAVSRSRQRVVHVCPVCQSRRVASKVVPQWRCAECVAAGLDGRMEIMRSELRP